MSDYLKHYGVAGQKWGVRRYQNDDGTLTAEGRERYGGMRDYGDKGFIKKWTLGSENGAYAFAKWRERRHQKNINKTNLKYGHKELDQKNAISQLKEQSKEARKRGDNKTADFLEGVQMDTEAQLARTKEKHQQKLNKYQSKKAAQSAANRNLDAYRRHSSTAKLVMQNSIPIAGTAYRHARARGESRLSSLLESVTPIGPILRMTRDKKAYGKYIVFAEPRDHEYTADVRLK